MQDEHSAILSRTQAHRDFFAEPEPEIFSLELAIEHTRAFGQSDFCQANSDRSSWPRDLFLPAVQ